MLVNGVVHFATITTEEQPHYDTVLARALERNLYADELNLRMDLEATHAGCPLDFKRLAEFDTYNFAHDLSGIRAYLNRETGELTRGFLPRCSKPQGS